MSFLKRFRFSVPPLRRSDGRRTTFGLCITTTNLLLFSHFFTTYCYSPCNPWGASMIPTLYFKGDGVIVSKRYRQGYGVKVGDVVTFKHPVKYRNGALKRVIGMPGDFVMLNSPDGPSDAMIQVPPGHCFVAGDNLAFSLDSRLFGPIPLALIEGKVIYCWWPFSRMGPITNSLVEVE